MTTVSFAGLAACLPLSLRASAHAIIRINEKFMMRRLACGVLPLLAAVHGASAFAEGGVRGEVTFSGKAPEGTAVKMKADPKCLDQHKEGFTFETVAAGPKGELSNVFVYVKKGLEGKGFQAPKEPKVILDQKGCWYHPHVSGIMVGQTLQIVNSDPTMHNVNAQPNFNAAMPAGIKPLEKTFKKARVMFPIKCNVHPWMKAYIGVLEHPYYAVSGKDGAFEIKGLPPGRYTLEAWHERLGVAVQEVTVAASGATAAFKFDGEAKGKP